jgi:hypothetical protein
MPNQILSCTQNNDANGNPLSYTFAFELDDGNGNLNNQTIVIQASSLDTPTDVTAASTAAQAQAQTIYQNWLNQEYPATVDVSSQVAGPVSFNNVAIPAALSTAIAANNPVVANPVGPAQPAPASGASQSL